MKRRTTSKDQRGFALLVVVILLALMTAATALALDNAIASLRSHAGVRASEMVKSATDFGVSTAVAQIQNDDIEVILNPGAHPLAPPGTTSFDIFDKTGLAGTPAPYVPSLAYPPPRSRVRGVAPPAHPFEGLYDVRVGLVRSQRARAPSGEDVRSTYGQVLELQVAVQATGPVLPPVEERVSVGVMVPRKMANAK